MRSGNEFVTSDVWGTLYNQMIDYFQHKKALDDAIERKRKYESELKKPTDWSSKELSFKEQVEIYNIIEKLINLGHRFHDEFNIYDIKQRFAIVYSGVPDFKTIDKEIEKHNLCIGKILTDHISFEHPFRNEKDNNHCYPVHSFVRLDGELRCVCCGMSTKDFELTKEELDFLTIVARAQGHILKDATKDDMPLIEVLLDRESTNVALFSSTEKEDELDPMSRAEEDYLALEGIPTSINASVRKAHELDERTYDQDKMNPDYLPREAVYAVISRIEKEIKEYQKSESRFKKLMIEMCRTTKYEVLILSGRHIPTLLNEAESEEEKIALTKAYFNLMREYYRSSSEYFKNHSDASFYPCITANQEINNRILEMKLRR